MRKEKSDLEAAKKLSDFLPDRIFDAHCHVFDTSFIPSGQPDKERVIGGLEKYREEMADLLCFPKKMLINAITYPVVQMKDKSCGILE